MQDTVSRTASPRGAAANALLDLCLPHCALRFSVPRPSRPSPLNPLATKAKRTIQKVAATQDSWTLQSRKLLQSTHQRWRRELEHRLASASPVTVNLIAPCTDLGPLDAALILSRLTATEVAILDAPVRQFVVNFRRKAQVLLWHNPTVRCELMRNALVTDQKVAAGSNLLSCS